MRMTFPLVAVAVATVAGPAYAYIGPGAGLSLLTAFATLLAAMAAVVGFVLWYPIRRMLRLRRLRATPPAAAPDGRAHAGGRSGSTEGSRGGPAD